MCVFHQMLNLFIPTCFVTILESRDQEIGGFDVVQERRTTDFEAPKLLKGWSGCYLLILPIPTDTFIMLEPLESGD